jgi:hypothetical protein
MSFLEQAGADAVSDLDDAVPGGLLDVVIDGVVPVVSGLANPGGLLVKLPEARRVARPQVADEEGAEQTMVTPRLFRVVGRHQQVEPGEEGQALFGGGGPEQFVHNRRVQCAEHRAAKQKLPDLAGKRVELFEGDVLEERVGAAQLLERDIATAGRRPLRQ